MSVCLGSSVCVCVCELMCTCLTCVRVRARACVCVTDCAAPPARATAVTKEVCRLSGGRHRLTPIRSNVITVCVYVFVRFMKVGPFGGGGRGGGCTDRILCCKHI